MKRLISAHNSKVLRPKTNDVNVERCNCEDGVEYCPLNGNCLVENIVYKAIVSSQLETKEYIGQTMNSFKERYGNLKNSFKKSYKRKSTKLAGYVWELKEKGILDPDIQWSIVRKSLPYQGGGGLCNLCIDEKTLICSSNPVITLNSRSEIMQKCKHKEPFYLNNFHGLTLDQRTVTENDEEEDSLLLPLRGEDNEGPPLHTIHEQDEEDHYFSPVEGLEEDGQSDINTVGGRRPLLTVDGLVEAVGGQLEEEPIPVERNIITGERPDEEEAVTTAGGEREEEQPLRRDDTREEVLGGPDGIITRRRAKNLRNYKYFKL